jgi:hypothetical protein
VIFATLAIFERFNEHLKMAQDHRNEVLLVGETFHPDLSIEQNNYRFVPSFW